MFLVRSELRVIESKTPSFSTTIDGTATDERRADRFIARLMDADAATAGTALRLSFDPGRLHLFDAQTHAALN